MRQSRGCIPEERHIQTVLLRRSRRERSLMNPALTPQANQPCPDTTWSRSCAIIYSAFPTMDFEIVTIWGGRRGRFLLWPKSKFVRRDVRWQHLRNPHFTSGVRERVKEKEKKGRKQKRPERASRESRTLFLDLNNITMFRDEMTGCRVEPVRCRGAPSGPISGGI